MASSCDTTTSNWPSTPGLGNLPPTTGFPGSSRLTCFEQNTTSVQSHEHEGNLRLSVTNMHEGKTHQHDARLAPPKLATYALGAVHPTAYAPLQPGVHQGSDKLGTTRRGRESHEVLRQPRGEHDDGEELDISDTTYACEQNTMSN